MCPICRGDCLKLIITVIGAVMSAMSIRWLSGVLVFAFPPGTWAADLAVQVAYLPTQSFWSAAGVATLGGAASLYHDLANGVSKFSILNAIGHMTSAQFAGLMLYLMAVNWEFTWPMTLAASGLGGWGGNRTITAVNDALVRKMTDKPL